ncbi:Uncharacterised protein [Dermatophilus congolensis]|uniref:Uncharacterized protein n=1 Tax=Dermatophilus congolensis TaxID=1863 RepID=A0A239V8T9_9MICO|nr:Uncharacterised protein [Dermatophilus congolensis]
MGGSGRVSAVGWWCAEVGVLGTVAVCGLTWPVRQVGPGVGRCQALLGVPSALPFPHRCVGTSMMFRGGMRDGFVLVELLVGWFGRYWCPGLFGGFVGPSSGKGGMGEGGRGGLIGSRSGGWRVGGCWDGSAGVSGGCGCGDEGINEGDGGAG